MTPGQFQKAIGTLDAEKAALWHGPMVAAMERANVETPLRQAHFLAQIAHESGSLRWLQEIAPGSVITPAQRYKYFEDKYGAGHHRDALKMGNTEPGDGAKYFGRGPLQCTWKNNYREFGTWFSLKIRPVNAVLNPEVLLEPEVGAMFCAWYWMAKGINSLADADNLEGVTRKVNGGLTHIEDRRSRLVLAKRALAIAA